MESNLESFRWMNFDSNESLDVEVENEQRDELEVSELEWSSLFSIEETNRMDETLVSSWNGMLLVEGNLFSNE